MDEALILSKIYSKTDMEFRLIVDQILENDEFKKRLDYMHHENRSVFVHSLIVSFYSYRLAKIFHLDYMSAAIGGMLHDFYYEDWQKKKDKCPFFQSHGFVHPKEALENSKKHFPGLVNKKVADIIIRHMFPLTLVPPKYLEGWLITLVDKFVSLEILKTPKQWSKYIGLKKSR